MHLTSMRNIALTIAYDGTDFLGWQKTPFGRSIEETLWEALNQILQHPVQLQAASRTDAGVHAEAQVVNFFTSSSRYSLEKLIYSLNALLPKDLVVLHAEEKAEDFHPTLSSQGKLYRYNLSLEPYQLPTKRHYFWHFGYPLDLEKIEEAKNILLGKQDFSAFCNDRNKTLKDPICHLKKIYFEKHSSDLFFFIEGDRFLYKMVRNIVGTLAYIGSHKLPMHILSDAFVKKDRKLLGITAPAKGLTLYKVYY